MSQLAPLFERAQELQFEINYGDAHPAVDELNDRLYQEGLSRVAVHAEHQRIHLAGFQAGKIALQGEIFYYGLGGFVEGFSLQDQEKTNGSDPYEIGALVRPFNGNPRFWVPTDEALLVDLDSMLEEDDTAKALTDEFIQDRLDLKRIDEVLRTSMISPSQDVLYSSLIQYLADPCEFYDRVYPVLLVVHSENGYRSFRTHHGVGVPLSDTSNFAILQVHNRPYLSVRIRTDHTTIAGDMVAIMDGDSGVEYKFST